MVRLLFLILITFVFCFQLKPEISGINNSVQVALAL